ncbi:hypothetical protein GCK72_005792 [Caenorhabditis remanei]|uniref:Uncharacterized protein n=1 Tax=Caenorhabditis remanei TaxID=31234 RepID=A0A6A5HF75_CAERE|nr:hypothetical protein GCK72_005792 [Caenorhabditis remanei]KAF1765839.1 hypothetical protein GCK72_005792 [Caenorhabditis remanei]
MGESSAQVAEGPQPKPSRFQFVPVPGEFTRGRWKCRDSYHPNAETLEFEKNKTKEEANPEKISVFFKLRQPEEEESTIQVTSVENKEPDNGDEVSNSSESIIITRKNGVTIVRKTSNSLLPEKYDQIRELSIDDFENKPDEKAQQVPPTPMNTPPASMAVLDTGIQAIVDSSLSPHSSRKPSNEDKTDMQKLADSSITSITSSSSLPLETSKPTRHFQVEPVVLSEPSTPAPVAPAPSIETLAPSPTVHSENHPLNEPTFQVIQTEESKNMSMDSVKNVIDAALMPPQTDRLNLVDEVETPTNVMITVSAALEKKETAVAGSVGSLDACGIPIACPPISAPHSTPYGTPKETQNIPIFEEVFSTNVTSTPPTIITTTTAPTTAPASSPVSSSVPASASSSSVTLPSVTTTATVNTSALTTPSAIDSHTPIDNKIEQAMELVKTHLTYAVREEVDTLRNTIAELEYQMREFQYECNYYRQNCSPEVVDQASAFVHQQMSAHQRPTRKAVSSTNVIFDGISAQNASASASASSAHMRNLQNQIQQMKQIAPITTNISTNTATYNSTPSATVPPKPSPTTSESSLNNATGNTPGAPPTSN